MHVRTYPFLFFMFYACTSFPVDILDYYAPMHATCSERTMFSKPIFGYILPQLFSR